MIIHSLQLTKILLFPKFQENAILRKIGFFEEPLNLFQLTSYFMCVQTVQGEEGHTCMLQVLKIGIFGQSHSSLCKAVHRL